MQDINISVICGRLPLKQHMNVLPQIARINTDFFFWITDFAEFTDFRVYKGVASDKSDKSVIYSIQEKSVLFVICGRISSNIRCSYEKFLYHSMPIIP